MKRSFAKKMFDVLKTKWVLSELKNTSKVLTQFLLKFFKSTWKTETSFFKCKKWKSNSRKPTPIPGLLEVAFLRGFFRALSYA